jgi:hypothetical protein
VRFIVGVRNNRPDSAEAVVSMANDSAAAVAMCLFIGWPSKNDSIVAELLVCLLRDFQGDFYFENGLTRRFDAKM